MKSKHHRFEAVRRDLQPWQWKRRKREIVLNRRPELYRGKYRAATKDQLVEKDVLMPVKHNVFPCGTFRMSKRFSSGLHGNTAAGSVRSEWPLWPATKTKQSARRRIKVKAELKLKKQRLWRKT
ncbi:hypothetical protein TNCV_3526071 [Trichonephila clavipes]|nr:hypothetical protein TNCV_3526071 [Trichonephila clavipes]